MVYTLSFFSSKCSLVHNSSIFGSCINYILCTGCAKIKKNIFQCQKFFFSASPTLAVMELPIVQHLIPFLSAGAVVSVLNVL